MDEEVRALWTGRDRTYRSRPAAHANNWPDFRGFSGVTDFGRPRREFRREDLCPGVTPHVAHVRRSQHGRNEGGRQRSVPRNAQTMFRCHALFNGDRRTEDRRRTDVPR